jgi:hypothetical protein
VLVVTEATWTRDRDRRGRRAVIEAALALRRAWGDIDLTALEDVAKTAAGRASRRTREPSDARAVSLASRQPPVLEKCW